MSIHFHSDTLSLPALGLGTWKSADKDVGNAIEYAIECGYRHIDCAPIYMNEKPVGQAFKNCIQSKVVKREDLWITSKLWNSFHDPDHVVGALKQTLHFMQLDYLDLYLMHWPVAAHPSVGYRHITDAKEFVSLDDIPLHETWLAMQECRTLGLVKHLGVSNFSINKLQSLIDKTTIAPSVNQFECHPYLTQQSLIKYCKDNHIHTTAYAPLGSGDRPDMLKHKNEPTLLNNIKIIECAQQLDCTPAQVLLAWSLQHVDSVIPKSTNPQRIQENQHSQQITLNDKQINTINSLNLDYRYCSGDFFCIEDSPYRFDTLWN